MVYKIMGHVPERRESNQALDPSDQTQLEEVVIYETDDEAEVRRIMDAGGFINEAGLYHAATRVVTDDGGEVDPFPRKSQVLPENSTAEIDGQGRVRTDRGKRPVTPEDVAAMANAEQPPALRKIQP